MIPSDDPVNSSAASPSAGQMLRAAREAKGVHLAVLSANLKISVRQLEALEADRHADLKGVMFVRALAQSVCRQLGMDPAPVLAALPQTHLQSSIAPESIEKIKETYAESPSNGAGKRMSRQVLILAVLMLLGVAVLVWWPNDNGASGPEATDPALAAVPMGQASNPQESAEPAASAEQATQAGQSEASQPQAPASAPALAPASAPALAPASAPRLVASAAASAAVAASSAPLGTTTQPAAATLQIRMQADAWIEVRDAKGLMVVKRLVKAGETLQLSLVAPLFVYVGKADSAELHWQGQRVDLKPHTHNNEARLQIKP